jgi:hypothetical protein
MNFDGLSMAQKQKILVLWLLLSTNPGTLPGQIDPDDVLNNKWNNDIGPHVAELPYAKECFASDKVNTGILVQVARNFQAFAVPSNGTPPIWGGGGVCAMDYATIQNLLTKI